MTRQDNSTRTHIHRDIEVRTDLCSRFREIAIRVRELMR